MLHFDRLYGGFNVVVTPVRICRVNGHRGGRRSHAFQNLTAVPFFAHCCAVPGPPPGKTRKTVGAPLGLGQLWDVSVMDLALGVNDYSLVGPQLGVRGVVQTCLWAWRLASAEGLTRA